MGVACAPAGNSNFHSSLAGIGIEGAEVIVHGGGGEDQTASGYHGTAESDGAGIRAGEVAS